MSFNVICRTCAKCRNANPLHKRPQAAAQRELRRCPTPDRCEFEVRSGTLNYAPTASFGIVRRPQP